MKKILAAVVINALIVINAFAAPFSNKVTNDRYSGVRNGIPTANDNNDGVPDLNDAVNRLLGTHYRRNSDLDNRFIASDALFYGEGNYSVSLIGLTAGNNNTLGFYTDVGTGNNKTEVLPYHSDFGFTGNGSRRNPYAAATFNVTGDFGWYLQTNGPYNYDTYYSEAGINDGGWDHMMTFDMSELNGQTRYISIEGQTTAYTFDNAFLIGWEDLPYGYNRRGRLGDDDYDDMMYLIDIRPSSLVPETEVPVPASLGLFSLVLLGGLLRGKRAKV